MDRIAVPKSFLERLVEKAASKRYGVSGPEFIEAVANGDVGRFPGSDDLTELVRNHILT